MQKKKKEIYIYIYIYFGNCGNPTADNVKKNYFGNCGNPIADNVKKKKIYILAIVAIPLPIL